MIQKIKHLNSIIARRAYKFCDRWSSHYWHDFPLTKKPMADKKAYLDLWETEKAHAYPALDDFEKKTGFTIDKDWMDSLALHTQIVIKNSPLCYQHGRILYSALRDYISKQDSIKTINVLETGTGRGFSSLVMAQAIEDSKKNGHILTLDLLPHHKKIYWNCVDDLNGTKTRAEILEPWANLRDNYVTFLEGDSRILIPKIGTNRIHFAFLDGAHTYRDIMAELHMIQERQEKGDIVVFDDYNTIDFNGLVNGIDEGCRIWHYDKKIISTGAKRAYVIATKTG